MPSHAPSEIPSKSPQPSIRPSQQPSICEDDSTWYYVKKGDQKDCTEVEKDPEKRCNDEDVVNPEDQRLAFEGCPLTCGACVIQPSAVPSSSPVSPTTSSHPSVSAQPSVCVDDENFEYRDNKNKRKDCEDVADKPEERCSEINQETGVVARDACPVACDLCTPTTRRRFLKGQ